MTSDDSDESDESDYFDADKVVPQEEEVTDNEIMMINPRNEEAIPPAVLNDDEVTDDVPTAGDDEQPIERAMDQNLRIHIQTQIQGPAPSGIAAHELRTIATNLLARDNVDSQLIIWVNNNFAGNKKPKGPKINRTTEYTSTLAEMRSYRDAARMVL